MFDKKAMLVELTIRQWTARKHDKSVSQEVDKGHGAKDAGRFNKILIAKEALEPIAKKANALRDFHYAKTMPWSNSGQRLLPSALFLDYRHDIVALRGEFNTEVSKFLDNYPSLIQEARARLNTLFNPDDYPSLKTLERAFSVDMDILPVPTVGDFRAEVAVEYRDELLEEVKQATLRRQSEATSACFGRVRGVLERMKSQCVEGKTRVTESLVDSMHEVANIMDAMNIMDDPELTRVVSEIRNDLLIDVTTLRNNPQVRKAAGDRATEILDSMGSISWS